jgi:hypothetical protein
VDRKRRAEISTRVGDGSVAAMSPARCGVETELRALASVAKTTRARRPACSVAAIECTRSGTSNFARGTVNASTLRGVKRRRSPDPRRRRTVMSYMHDIRKWTNKRSGFAPTLDHLIRGFPRPTSCERPAFQRDERGTTCPPSSRSLPRALARPARARAARRAVEPREDDRGAPSSPCGRHESS